MFKRKLKSSLQTPVKPSSGEKASSGQSPGRSLCAGRVTFLLADSSKVVLTFGGEESVLQLASKGKVDIPNSCEGSGTCGTCRVFIRSEGTDAHERGEVETEFATERGFSNNERLSCQIKPEDGMILEIP